MPSACYRAGRATRRSPPPELLGGWVHPDTLVRRYAKNLADGATILRHDFTAALLRVRVPEVLPPYATDEQRQDAQTPPR